MSGSDEEFLDALHRADVQYSSPAEAIGAGSQVCRLLGEGQSRDDILKLLKKRNEELTTARAGTFFDIAIRYLCPEYLGQPS